MYIGFFDVDRFKTALIDQRPEYGACLRYFRPLVLRAHSRPVRSEPIAGATFRILDPADMWSLPDMLSEPPQPTRVWYECSSWSTAWATQLISYDFLGATLLSFIAALVHFTVELLVFKTSSVRGVVTPSIIAGNS